MTAGRGGCCLCCTALPLLSEVLRPQRLPQSAAVKCPHQLPSLAATSPGSGQTGLRSPCDALAGLGTASTFVVGALTLAGTVPSATPALSRQAAGLGPECALGVSCSSRVAAEQLCSWRRSVARLRCNSAICCCCAAAAVPRPAVPAQHLGPLLQSMAHSVQQPPAGLGPEQARVQARAAAASDGTRLNTAHCPLHALLATATPGGGGTRGHLCRGRALPPIAACACCGAPGGGYAPPDASWRSHDLSCPTHYYQIGDLL